MVEPLWDFCQWVGLLLPCTCQRWNLVGCISVPATQNVCSSGQSVITSLTLGPFPFLRRLDKTLGLVHYLPTLIICLQGQTLGFHNHWVVSMGSQVSCMSRGNLSGPKWCMVEFPWTKRKWMVLVHQLSLLGMASIAVGMPLSQWTSGGMQSAQCKCEGLGGKLVWAKKRTVSLYHQARRLQEFFCLRKTCSELALCNANSSAYISGPHG